MKFTPAHYANALYEALEDAQAKDHDKILDNFVKTLVEQNDLRMFDQIEEEFDRLEKAKQGVRIADVASAKPLSKQSEKAIIDKLNKIAKSDVVIRKKIDESLIGGVVIKMDDTLIDASLKRSLEELKNNLSE